MPHFPESGKRPLHVAEQLQQTVHGLVEEFFEMLGDGEAGSILLKHVVLYDFLCAGPDATSSKPTMSNPQS